MKLRSAVLAFTTTALVLTSGTAFADTLTKADPAGDVAKAEGDSETTTIDPAYTNGDITRTVINHGARKVRIKIVHRDLAKTGHLLSMISVRSNKGRAAARNFVIVAAPGAYGGKVQVENATGQARSCRTTRTIDYAANTTVLEIPRSCLAYPKWVRVGVGVVTSPDKFTTVYLDDARTNGSVSGNELVLSKRVYR